MNIGIKPLQIDVLKQLYFCKDIKEYQEIDISIFKYVDIDKRTELLLELNDKNFWFYILWFLDRSTL
jgi:hypothetical protein